MDFGGILSIVSLGFLMWGVWTLVHVLPRDSLNTNHTTSASRQACLSIMDINPVLQTFIRSCVSWFI